MKEKKTQFQQLVGTHVCFPAKGPGTSRAFLSGIVGFFLLFFLFFFFISCGQNDSDPADLHTLYRLRMPALIHCMYAVGISISFGQPEK